MADFSGYATHTTEVKDAPTNRYPQRRFKYPNLGKEGYCKGTVADIEVITWEDGNESVNVACAITEGELMDKTSSGRFKVTTEGEGTKVGYNVLESCGITKAKLAKAKNVDTEKVFGQLVGKECYFTLRQESKQNAEGETFYFTKIARFVLAEEYDKQEVKLREPRT